MNCKNHLEKIRGKNCHMNKKLARRIFDQIPLYNSFLKYGKTFYHAVQLDFPLYFLFLRDLYHFNFQNHENE